MAKNKEGRASFFTKSIGGGAKKAIKYPDKKTINLVRYETEKSNLKDILVIMLIVVGLIAFAKFGILDQYDKLREAQRQYGIVQDQLTQLRQANARYDEVKAQYDEVTDWYMTTDEKAIVDKEEVIAMLEQDLMPYVELTRVQVSGNTITVSTGITDLATVSTFLLKLQNDPRNATATVTTTSAASSTEGEERVTASVIISFIGDQPVQAEPEISKEELRKKLLGEDA